MNPPKNRGWYAVEYQYEETGTQLVRADGPEDAKRMVNENILRDGVSGNNVTPESAQHTLGVAVRLEEL